MTMTLTKARECMKVFGRSEMDLILDRYDDEGVLLAALDCRVSKVGETYQGEYDSDEEFVREMLEEDIPGLAELPWYVCIDWETTAEDVMMNYCESDGHYFHMI